MKKSIAFSVWLICLVAVVIGAYFYFENAKLHPSTDDAYVQANTIEIASQVSGAILKIYVQNNQLVKKNELLFTIDPTPFQYALNKAKANLRLVQQKIAVEKDEVAAARSELERSKANYYVVKQNVPRTLELARTGKVSKAEKISAIGELKAARAEMLAAKSKFEESIANLGVKGKNNAALLAAKATLNQAKLNLQYTKIRAPETGYLVNFNLRPGTVINANQPLFALIENNLWWVNANYKETDLAHIKPGQSAKIILDAYPNHIYKGLVQSISFGSGAAFSLLPPENATGNWVKVTQRFPVKILIIDPLPSFPLRVGESATVTINTLKV